MLCVLGLCTAVFHKIYRRGVRKVVMKELEFEIGFERRGKETLFTLMEIKKLGRRKKSSPGERNNRSVFCIQITQILRNKLKREKTGIIFSAKFCYFHQ